MTRRTFLATAASASAMQPPAVRSGLGFSPDAFAILRPGRGVLELMEKAYEVGAGGVQGGLPSLEPDYLKKVRQRAEQLGMYWELTIGLPGEDTTQFVKTMAAAKEAGAGCARSVCLSGRRYETFNTLEQWKTFVADSHTRLARTVPLLDKLKFPLGLENHKDWVAGEMPGILKKYSSEYFGACIDFGNNMALLDDPMELIEALAPFVINTHIKDMGVEEYEDGFLLSEVPLGQGLVDLKRAVPLLQKHRPNVKFSLDMLTRDPLKVPCLTDKYWLTFTERNGKYLARMLALVRKNKRPAPLPRVTGLTKEAALKMEMDNLTQSVLYARDHLGLKA